MKELSIIIPVYNSELFIGACIESIYRQAIPYDCFEVICVNDGSTDNSLDLLKKYHNTFPNFIVLEQENKGVSCARNHGIQEASGKYILFLDSDDELIDNSMREILKLTERQDNIIVCRTIRDDGSEAYLWHNTFLDGVHYLPTDLPRGGYLRGSACGCLFLRSFIIENNVAFPLGVQNSEDMVFFLSCLYFTDYIVFKKVLFYKVISRNASLSRRYNKSRIDLMLSSLPLLDNIYSNLKGHNENKSVIEYMRYTFISQIVYCAIKTDGVGLGYLLNSGVKKYSIFNIDSNVVFLRRKIKLLNFSFSLFYITCLIKSVWRK